MNAVGAVVFFCNKAVFEVFVFNLIVLCFIVKDIQHGSNLLFAVAGFLLNVKADTVRTFKTVRILISERIIKNMSQGVSDLLLKRLAFPVVKARTLDKRIPNIRLFLGIKTENIKKLRGGKEGQHGNHKCNECL